VTLEFRLSDLTPLRAYFAAHTSVEGAWRDWDRLVFDKVRYIQLELLRSPPPIPAQAFLDSCSSLNSYL
jgi:hypothetical protein